MQMFNKVMPALPVLVFLSLSICMDFGTQALASSKGEPKVEAKNSDNCRDSVLIEKSSSQFATLPANSRAIIIVAEGAKILIKRGNTSEITLSSNCPRNWCVKGTLVRQAGFSGEPRKGSALLADDLGSRAIVSGQVYLFPPGPMKGIKMGVDGVFINGQKVDPLKGSDMPGTCSGEDLLLVNVPQGYNGDLKIGSAGKSAVTIESWKGGALELTMLGESTFQASKLDSLAKAAFDNKGRGSAEIAELDAKIFVANTKGNGNPSIRVKKGQAEMSNATVEGNGTIELHGNFRNLQQMVEGQGKIEVKP